MLFHFFVNKTSVINVNNIIIANIAQCFSKPFSIGLYVLNKIQSMCNFAL